MAVYITAIRQAHQVERLGDRVDKGSRPKASYNENIGRVIAV